jgi:hypothetical protein
MVAEMPKQNTSSAKFYAKGKIGRDRDSAWPHEAEAASRWREVLLRLSDEMTHASQLRPDLAPILFSALDYAIEVLLTQGCEEQLMRLEQWLGEVEPTPCGAPVPLDRGAVVRMAA